MLRAVSLSALLLGLSASLLGAAAPTSLDVLAKRIVINPPVTAPNATTIWKTGQKNVMATWQVPAGSEGYRGSLRLGYLDKNDLSGNEHLFPKPLAEGFSLTDGNVTFNVPCDNNIKSRATYIVVLMGDSGNKSEKFTIRRDADKCPNFKKKKDNKPKPKPAKAEPSKSADSQNKEDAPAADNKQTADNNVAGDGDDSANDDGAADDEAEEQE